MAKNISTLLKFQVEPSFLAVYFLMILIGISVLSYLDSGNKTYHSSSLSCDRKLEKNNIKFDQINGKKHNDLNPATKKIIIKNVVSQINNDAIDTLFNEKVKSYKESIEKSLLGELIVNDYSHSHSRLSTEIKNLTLRSNVNLVIGMTITIMGLFFLWSTVNLIDTSEISKQISENSENGLITLEIAAIPFISRLSLVFFIELFAFFFLRLYKQGLDEIKYFQNELTNIESKVLAARLAIKSNDSEAMKSIIIPLVNTERNHILLKGQTTVELEKAKSDSTTINTIISSLPNIFKNK
ncbi:hypothetical protein [Photobacterium sp. J15]|uniref:hypothetical protein n=1 Tax=Photobacterium sp. J15 TaxID=265901 RepID=UPI0012EE7F28|nr:hypothetical protein [Photobacterium sp. J15]